MEITDEMVDRADSVLSRVRKGIPDEAIRLALAAALSTDTDSVYEGKHTIPMVRVVTEDDIDIREKILTGLCPCGDVMRGGRCQCGNFSNPTLNTNAPSSLAVVPEGWQLVPVEPTQEMLQRGADSCCSLTVHGAYGVYRSMLASDQGDE